MRPQMFMTFYELWQKMGLFLRYFPHCTEVFIASHLFHLHGHGGRGALTKASGSDDVAIDVLRCAGKVGPTQHGGVMTCVLRMHWVNLLQLLLEQGENHGLEYFGHDVITEFYTFNILNVSTHAGVSSRALAQEKEIKRWMPRRIIFSVCQMA